MPRATKKTRSRKPGPERPLTVLVLNGSLKRSPKRSNTEELARLVLKEMEAHARIDSTIIRLADRDIPAGVGFREGARDEWPAISRLVRDADVVIFATPIWWGGRSSLMQRVIERMDAFDEEAHAAGGREALRNKVAGIVITGSEDGAQATAGSIMEVLTFMKLTLPPDCCAYWVGEVGKPPEKDAERRRKSAATKKMAKTLAGSLAYYARLLRERPMPAQR